MEESALSAVERAEYDGFWDQVRRNTALMDDLKEAHEKLDAAMAERDAAVEKMRQDKLDTARQMKADGMAVGTIAKYTGLAADEIEAL